MELPRGARGFVPRGAYLLVDLSRSNIYTETQQAKGKEKVKKISLLILAITLVASLSWIVKSHTEKSCFESAGTQADMNRCAQQELDKYEKDLKALTDKLEKRYATSPEKLKNFKEARKSWERYVKNQIDLLYSESEGSVSGMCSTLDVARLTQQRLEQLQEWDQRKEGYVCDGL